MHLSSADNDYTSVLHGSVDSQSEFLNMNFCYPSLKRNVNGIVHVALFFFWAACLLYIVPLGMRPMMILMIQVNLDMFTHMRRMHPC